MLSCWSLLNVFKRWLEAVRWQPARGFATVQDSLMLKYQIIADGYRYDSPTSTSSFFYLRSFRNAHTNFQQIIAPAKLDVVVDSLGLIPRNLPCGATTKLMTGIISWE
jgi:hypothetical protein